MIQGFGLDAVHIAEQHDRAQKPVDQRLAIGLLAHIDLARIIWATAATGRDPLWMAHFSSFCSVAYFSVSSSIFQYTRVNSSASCSRSRSAMTF